MSIKIKQLSSLGKVYKDKIFGKSTGKMSCAKGQELSYQIAYFGEGEYTFKVSSPLKKYITVYQVGYVPSDLPIYPSCNDGKYERWEKGLFPDPLFPKKNNKITASKEYNALWLNVKLPNDIKAGKYDITVTFKGEDQVSTSLSLNVENICYDKKEIIFTQWFHTDCIANAHKVEVYSEKHWELIRKYMKMARENGITMILVPVLTPPLDTAVGGERLTTQLVDITYDGARYEFDFARFDRFISTARECGIEYFEINHMFTQWGAKNAPKVIATVNGEKKKIFGWETEATGKEYKEFLEQLIPALIERIKELGIDKKQVYFHASDEPGTYCIDSYKGAVDILKPLVEGYNLIDALSDVEFYKNGLIKKPVVGIDYMESFVNEGIEGLWGYYCCAQTWDVPNRFMSMASPRNRITGALIYLYRLEGFLQWGYNFYNSQYSKKKINPYKVTDAGGAFPSGDPFSVYPYRGGVIPSLRIKVFKEALDDVALLYAVEAKIGREATEKMLEEVMGQRITFKSFPIDEAVFVKLQKEAFKILKK